MGRTRDDDHAHPGDHERPETHSSGSGLEAGAIPLSLGGRRPDRDPFLHVRIQHSVRCVLGLDHGSRVRGGGDRPVYRGDPGRHQGAPPGAVPWARGFSLNKVVPALRTAGRVPRPRLCAAPGLPVAPARRFRRARRSRSPERWFRVSLHGDTVSVVDGGFFPDPPPGTCFLGGRSSLVDGLFQITPVPPA